MRAKTLGIEKERNEVNKPCLKPTARVVNNDTLRVWDTPF